MRRKCTSSEAGLTVQVLEHRAERREDLRAVARAGVLITGEGGKALQKTANKLGITEPAHTHLTP
jgi:hypothetical protein